jgi:hypothetical protein
LDFVAKLRIRDKGFFDERAGRRFQCLLEPRREFLL